MDIKEIFQGIANKMLTDFDQIQAQIEHAGERGKQRERAFKNFLEKYLPKKYSLGTGHVLDRNGKLSKQCDIVIYDALNCPLLLSEEDYQLFPVEAVFGVIEVKSVFDASTIVESAQNIQSVKCLERWDEPVFGGVFAYRSKYDSKSKIEVAANALSRANKSIIPPERVDLVCILSDGILLDYKEAPDWGENDSSALLAFLEATPSNLLLFLYYLLTMLDLRHSAMPDLLGYSFVGASTGGEIGIVKQFPPASE